MNNLISISPGNDKLGSIPSISLPPIKTCIKNAPCRKVCYARLMGCRRPVIARAWERNLKIYNKNSGMYWLQLDHYLRKENPPYFRFHVGGDIPDKAYFEQLIFTAKIHPKIHFLVFTKRYSWVTPTRGVFTNNLSVILSAWKGLPIPKRLLGTLPVAWMNDVNDPDPRIPRVHVKCKGDCGKCGKKCWFMGKLQTDVVFDKH